MSKNGMIGAIVCALSGMETKYIGVVEDAVNRLNGKNADEWRTQLVGVFQKGLPQRETDSIIRVDRSVRPSYPDWVSPGLINSREFLSLEHSGPAEYDITTVRQWLCDEQENDGQVRGQRIFDYLKNSNALESCLGLSDLEEIQKKGIAFFRKHFQGRAVFGWKSVVWDSDAYLRVPYLCESGDEVVIRWGSLGNDWHSRNPALRFAD